MKKELVVKKASGWEEVENHGACRKDDVREQRLSSLLYTEKCLLIPQLQ